MANPEHLDILKQGVRVWNQWRKEHATVVPMLRDADLREADLMSADLRGADLLGANLQGANLRKAELSEADLSQVQLEEADLRQAILYHTRLSLADLTNANLSLSDLSSAHLRQTNLKNSNLKHTILRWAVFIGTDLRDADMTGALIRTTLIDIDLSVVKGLDAVMHDGPSNIGIDTIIRSQGKIPEIFLRKAGVPQSIIEQIPALIGSLKPIDFYTCFISYSSNDQEFAERLYADLQNNGVQCWYAPHDLRTGQRIRHGIDEAIRLHDKLLLILSEHSVVSTWVEFEVEAAIDKEKNGGEVLFPIRLDSSVLKCNVPWAAHLKRIRHIGNFTNWKSHDDYQQAFTRLLRDLKAGA